MPIFLNGFAALTYIKEANVLKVSHLQIKQLQTKLLQLCEQKKYFIPCFCCRISNTKPIK